MCVCLCVCVYGYYIYIYKYIYIYIYIAGADMEWDTLDVDSAFHEPEFGYSELELADYQKGGEGQKVEGTLLKSPQYGGCR